MYYKSRAEAGKMLAQQLANYRFDNCAVVALGEGSVVVAEQIAAKLHSIVLMFLSEQIAIPGEKVDVGAINQGGGFVNNQNLSKGELDDYYSEFHGYIEDQKREKFDSMNRLMGEGGVLNQEFLKDHIVIVVSDGLKSGTVLDSIAEFLKSIRIKRLIIAAPVASVEAVDRMHIIADELCCLSVTENFYDTNHYYDDKKIPTHEEAVKIIKNIVLKWEK